MNPSTPTRAEREEIKKIGDDKNLKLVPRLIAHPAKIEHDGHHSSVGDQWRCQIGTVETISEVYEFNCRSWNAKTDIFTLIAHGPTFADAVAMVRSR